VETSQPNRRSILAAAAALVASGSACGQALQSARPAPVRAADFLATIGVNTHLGYPQTQYGDVSAVLEALQFTGVKHVRDAAPSAKAPDAWRSYEALAAAGVGACLFWGAKRPMAEAIADLSALEALHPGAVDALEGPNEIKPNFAYAGRTGNAAAQAFMADMRSAARRDPWLERKPLVIFTTYARAAADCDFANQHPYPKAGAQPASLLQLVRDRNVGPDGVMPGKPMVFTELGYHTLVGKPTRPAAWQGVDPERQAILLVNALLDGAALGISRTYIYQLLDCYPDRGPPDQEKHFGLYRFDGSAKPAAKALRNLFARLSDDGPGARAFATNSFPARVAAPPLVSSLALQDSAGRNFLILWNEAPVWSAELAAPLESEPVSTRLVLERPGPLRAFDIIDSTGDRVFAPASSFAISLGAHPILLQIG